MKKIPTIFKRNPEKMSLVLNEVNPVCQWVFDGEGVVYKKYDGTCVLIDEDGYMLKRRMVKRGKAVPGGFIGVDYDVITEKAFGWVPVDIDAKENKYHMEAYLYQRLAPGTYELCGPKVQGNPENFPEHTLINHTDCVMFEDMPRDYDEIKEWIKHKDIEGLVFSHTDGRMAKIKKSDFGLKR